MDLGTDELVAAHGLLQRSPVKAGLRHFLSLGAALTLVAAAAGQPAPNEPLPQTPNATARALVDTTDSLRKAIDAWRASNSAAVPHDVTLYDPVASMLADVELPINSDSWVAGIVGVIAPQRGTRDV